MWPKRPVFKTTPMINVDLKHQLAGLRGGKMFAHAEILCAINFDLLPVFNSCLQMIVVKCYSFAMDYLIGAVAPMESTTVHSNLLSCESLHNSRLSWILPLR